VPELSRFAASRWQHRYADVDNAGIAAALRDWRGWRDEQVGLHPAYGAAIDDCYAGITAWLKAEARRRLAPAPRGKRMTTAQLLARHNDRLEPAGPDRWKCRCPWHADSRPSLMVYADAWCHCFACGEHRPVADLAAAWRGEVAA